jgi:thiol-disulfide isomerase/thioredoxin
MKVDEIAKNNVSDASANAEYRYHRFTTRLLFRDLRFQKETARAGDLFPSSTLFTTNGNQTTIEDLASGKPVLLIFGSLTCPMTASAMPALNELYRKFSERVEFVIINVREAHPGEFLRQPETAEEKQDHARALARHYALSWSVVSDDIDGHLHRNLDPKPNSAFLIDADGVIVFPSLWASDQTALHQALESVANGKRPARSESTTLLVPVIRRWGTFKRQWSEPVHRPSEIYGGVHFLWHRPGAWQRYLLPPLMRSEEYMLSLHYPCRS